MLEFAPGFFPNEWYYYVIGVYVVLTVIIAIGIWDMVIDDEMMLPFEKLLLWTFFVITWPICLLVFALVPERKY